MNEPEMAFSNDKKGKPLVVWDNPPGMKIEFYSDDLRDYAQMFLDTADALDRIEAAKRRA